MGRGGVPPACPPLRLPAQAARPKITVLRKRAASSEARRRVSMTGLLQGPKRGLRPCGEDWDLGHPDGARHRGRQGQPEISPEDAGQPVTDQPGKGC